MNDAQIREAIIATGGNLEDFIRFLTRHMVGLEQQLAAANNVIGTQNRAIARAHSLLLSHNIDDAMRFLLDAIEPEPSR